jgi:MFS family permease
MSARRGEQEGRESEPLLERRRSTIAHSNTSHTTRVFAMTLLFLMSTGANWTEACLGPLKPILLKEMAINNTQYGVISASTQLSNTILPIFTGLWIDRIGPSRMSIFATLTVCLGALLAAVASSIASYPLLVLGRIIQGTGVIIVDTAATKLIVRWSRGTGWLGMAISCNFAFDRVAGAISKATAVPIAQSGGRGGVGETKTGVSSTTFWFAALVSCISLLASIFYSGFERRHTSKPSTPITSHTSSLAMLKRTLNALPLFFVFIAVTQFYQPIAVFNNLSADIIRWKSLSPRASGYLASVGQVAPIFVAPLLGGFFDRYGHRME